MINVNIDTRIQESTGTLAYMLNPLAHENVQTNAVLN